MFQAQVSTQLATVVISLIPLSLNKDLRFSNHIKKVSEAALEPFNNQDQGARVKNSLSCLIPRKDVSEIKD